MGYKAAGRPFFGNCNDKCNARCSHLRGFIGREELFRELSDIHTLTKSFLLHVRTMSRFESLILR
jgi:hypothetical protein